MSMFIPIALCNVVRLFLGFLTFDFMICFKMSKVNKPNRCLICYSDSIQQNGIGGSHSNQSESASFLSEDLHVLFVLRTLFEIPRSTLQHYLTKHGSPSKWSLLAFCERCSEAVENAKGIYQEIVEASRIFKAVKGEIVETVKRSCRRHRNDNFLTKFEWEDEGERFTERTRHFIFYNNYGPSSDPFLEGDKAAKELLEKKKVKPKPTKPKLKPIKPAIIIPAISKMVIKTEPQEDLPPPQLPRYDYQVVTKQEPCEDPSMNPTFLQDPNDFEVDVSPNTASSFAVLTTELEDKIRIEQENKRAQCRRIRAPRIRMMKKNRDPLQPPTPRPKLYVCRFPKCNRSYANKSALTAHLMYHRGEKPFKCTWPGCQWAFTRADTLRRHYRVNHIPDGREWKCRFCGRTFCSRRDYLRMHFKIKHAEEVVHFGGLDALMEDAENTI